MSKIKFIILILGACLLAACAPSQQAVQTAVAETQAAIPTATSTLVPIATLKPTATVNPCSNRGWGDIATYLKQFDAEIKNLVVGTSIQTYLDSLSNYQELINNVVIDACLEHARQTIVAGMGNEIVGMQISLNNGKQEDATSALVQGMTMIKDARAELVTLGIVFNYP